METIKLSLSPVDRSVMVDMLPKTGNIEEVSKVKGWIDSIKFSDKENEYINSMNSIRDNTERDKAMNKYYNEKSDFEIDKEFFNVIVNDINSRNLANAISVEDPIELYKYLLEISNGREEK